MIPEILYAKELVNVVKQRRVDSTVMLGSTPLQYTAAVVRLI